MFYFKTLVFLLSLLTISVCLSAQNEKIFFDGEKKFYGGIVLGANISQVDGDDRSGYHKVGLNTGATVIWHFHPKVAANIELLFSQKGSKKVNEGYSTQVGSYWDKYTMHLNYVEVPFVFNYVHSTKWQFGLGASYNSLLNSKEEYEIYYPVNIDPAIYKFNSYEIELIASGTLNVWRGLFVNIRYQYSLTPIRDFLYVPEGLGSGHQFNNLLVFRLFYLL